MAPKKRVLAVVKIQLEAGSATPAPPVGTALGPHGVQTMEFCKQYNAATESQRGTVIPVDITIYEDRTFSFVLKTSPTPVLLRQAAGVAKGSATTGREQVGTITDAQLADIAQVKLKDLNTDRPRSGQEAGRRNSAFHGDQGRRLSDRTDRTTGDRRWPSTARSTGKHWRRSTARRSTASSEAVDIVKTLSSATFDETVELAVRLGVDPRKADQIVRGTLSLPSGTGRTERVAVFAAGEQAAEARAAGADVVGADDLVAKVNGGIPGLRRGHRHPRPDGPGGDARASARPPRPHAEPQDGHRHHGGGQGRDRVQGRPGRVPHRQGRQRAHPHRQGLVHP